MTKPNKSDTIARLALGLVIFLVMRFAPRAVEAWQKRKNIRRNAMSNLSLASTLTANMSKGGSFIKIYLTHKQSP